MYIYMYLYYNCNYNIIITVNITTHLTYIYIVDSLTVFCPHWSGITTTQHELTTSQIIHIYII